VSNANNSEQLSSKGFPCSSDTIIRLFASEILFVLQILLRNEDYQNMFQLQEDTGIHMI